MASRADKKHRRQLAEAIVANGLCAALATEIPGRMAMRGPERVHARAVAREIVIVVGRRQDAGRWRTP